MPIKILQKKLLKQDFLHLDIGNRHQKDFTEKISCLIESSAFLLETQICQRSQKEKS